MAESKGGRRKGKRFFGKTNPYHSGVENSSSLFIRGKPKTVAIHRFQKQQVRMSEYIVISHNISLLKYRLADS